MAGNINTVNLDTMTVEELWDMYSNLFEELPPGHPDGYKEDERTIDELEYHESTS